MYVDFKDLWESCSRNWFALLNFSLASSLALLLGTLAIAVLPPLLAAWCGLLMLFGGAVALGKLFIPAAAIWSMQTILLALISWRHGIPPAYALATPLGFALQCALALNSTFKFKSGAGVTWKERRIYASKGVVEPETFS